MELEKWNIFEWLKKAGMSQYAESFVDNGYDTPDLCAELQDDDLSAIGVNDKRHRTVLFTRARELMDLLKGGEGTDGPIKLQAAPVSPIVVATSPSNGQYSEPWQPWSGRGTGGGVGQTNGGTRVKMTRSSSGEKPPLPPPNKHKKRHPPPSPLATELPTFKREGGETGLTKLQLQLKIREELRAEGVVLSEPPYVNEEGQLCDGPLSELTERYSSKLKLQPLDIYDALNVIWNSENSFVTPLTPGPVQDAPHHHAVTLKGGSSENYDEPFDAADTVLTPDSVKYSPKEGSPKGTKSHTLPVNASSGNYEEPFDSMSKFQNTTSSEESEKLRTETQVQSKTLPSPKLKVAAEEKEKKKASVERESSPKHHSGFSKLFRRKDNKRSQSIKEVDSKHREERKNGKKGAKISFPAKTKDNAAASGKSQKKQNGASPRHSKTMETCSDTEESPQPTKVNELTKKFEALSGRSRPASCSIPRPYY